MKNKYIYSNQTNDENNEEITKSWEFFWRMWFDWLSTVRWTVTMFIFLFFSSFFVSFHFVSFRWFWQPQIKTNKLRECESNTQLQAFQNSHIQKATRFWNFSTENILCFYQNCSTPFAFRITRHVLCIDYSFPVFASFFTIPSDELLYERETRVAIQCNAILNF